MTIDLDDPVALLLTAVEAFERDGLDAAAYGGLALAMYGEPRETRDADLAVATVTAEAARAALSTTGLHTAIAFDGVVFGGVSISRISLVGGGALNTVDLIAPRSARYAHAILGRGLRGPLRHREIRVVTPEDFVILKVLSTRDRDLEDARTVVAGLGPRLDRDAIRDEIEQLAGEIRDHDVRGRFAALAV